MNGKKYEFSNEVLLFGVKLFNNFKTIQTSLRNVYNKICDETTVVPITIIKDEILRVLENFDKSWVEYESV